MRRLYYRDSYGRVHRDRQAERSTSGDSGLPARFFVTALLVLAAIVVLASLFH
jgi:Flp pilus assembly protein TadB